MTPELQKKTNEELTSRLEKISSAKIISLETEYEQEVLANEIIKRVAQNGDTATLTQLKQFTQQPAASSLEPKHLSKPAHLSSADIKGKDSFLTARIYNQFGANLEAAYRKFCEKAKHFENLEELEKAGMEIKELILNSYLRMNPDYDAKLTNGQSISTVHKEYFSDVGKSVDAVLDKARALNTGKVTIDTPPLLPADVFHGVEFQVMQRAYNNALSIFVNPNANQEEQNSAFQTLVQSSRSLFELANLSKNPEELKARVAPFVKIGDHHSSLDSVMEVVERHTALDFDPSLEEHQKDREVISILFPEETVDRIRLGKAIAAFNEGSPKLEDESIPNEEKEEAFKKLVRASKIIKNQSHLTENPDELVKNVSPILAIQEEYGSYTSFLEWRAAIVEHINGLQSDDPEIVAIHAQALEDLKLEEKDFEKLVGREKASNTKKEVLEAVQKILNLHNYSIKYGGVDTYVFSPGVRFLMHVLSDLNRFEGYEWTKYPQGVLSPVQLFSPEILPTAMNLPVAYVRGDSGIVGRALLTKIGEAYRSIWLNPFHLKDTIKGAESFKEGAGLLSQGTNSVQLITTIGCALIQGSLPNGWVSLRNTTAKAGELALTSAQGVNQLIRGSLAGAKLYNAMRIGSLREGLSAISDLGMMMLSIYEFAATLVPGESSDPSFPGKVKWGARKVIRWGLPTGLQEGLPESYSYYAAKGVGRVVTSVLALFTGEKKDLNSMKSSAIAELLSTLYDLRKNGAVQDQSLEAILSNLSYHTQLSPNPETQKRIDSSFANLEKSLGQNFQIKESDSFTVKQAKTFYFLLKVERLAKGGRSQEVIEMTEMSFTHSSTVFKKANLEVTEAISLLARRYQILLEGATINAQTLLQEVTQITPYLERARERMEDEGRAIIDQLLPILNQPSSGLAIA